MGAILKLENVSKSFGAIVMAADLDLELAEGEALGMLGPNGAGKTTLFGVITGTIAPNRRRVMFQGRAVTRVPASDRCRLRMAPSLPRPPPLPGIPLSHHPSAPTT